MQKAMDKLQKHCTTQLINLAKNMLSRPQYTHLEDILLDGKVRVWRKETKNTQGR